MNKSFFLVLFVLVIVGFFSVTKILKTQSVPKKSIDPNISLPVLILGAAPPSSNDLAARVIKQKGWDKEAGFQLELRGVAPEVAVLAIAGGTVDILGMTPITALKSVNPVKPIIIIANGNIVSCPFFVKQDSPAKKWQDLKGKRLGMTALAGPSYNMTKIAMKLKEGIDINEEFEVTNSPFQEIIPRLVRGEIDGALGRCGEVGIAKAIVEAKFRTIGNLTDILYKDGDFNELMMEAMITTKDWSKAHPDLVVKFRNTLYKAYSYIKEHPEVFDDREIQKAYALDSSSPEVISKVKELIPIFYTFADWKTAANSQYKFLEVAKQEGLIDSLPPKEELFFLTN